MKKSINRCSRKSQPFYLIVPFSYGTNLFTFRKKSNWNIIDHLLLRAIVDNELSIDELSKYSGIKRQILVQILLPFLKLGWIELLQEYQKISVRATARGKVISKLSELPSTKKEFYTYRDFLVNLINGQYLGLCNHPYITYYNQYEINALINSWDNKKYINIRNIPHPYILDTQDLAAAVTQPNEELISLSPPLDRNLSNNRYLIFNAKINKFDEIEIRFHENYLNPTSCDDYCHIFGTSFEKYLASEIKNRLIEDKKNSQDIKETYQYIGDKRLSENLENLPKNYKILEEHVSLVLGGDEHLQKFREAIHHCKNYLIIHSTFIRPSKINLYLNELLAAVNRGVKVIILWGKDDFDSPDIREQELRNFEEITLQFKKLYCEYNERIILHKIQTGSHAKYLLWDNENSHCSLIGSCNWFFSEFNRYEASVFIQDNDFTKEMIQISASLTTGAKLINNYLGSELLELAQSIKPSSSKNDEQKITVSLLFKGHHLRYVQKAKSAKHRVTLLSDKINQNLHRSIWDSLSTCKARISAFYSTVDQNFGHKQVKQFSETLEKTNISLKLHSPPSGNKSHAKVLAWDKNHIVVTSLNWMSSDSSGNYKNNDLYHELGVYIECNKIEQKFYANFSNNSSHE